MTLEDIPRIARGAARRAGALALLTALPLAGQAGAQATAQALVRVSTRVAPARPSRGTGVTVVRGPVEGADIVRAARRQLGVPYRLGGTTPAAFDCSGFVRWVFGEYGIALPRTAHEQAAIGDAPPWDGALAPGDLLFFWGGHGAQHIAIYVGGDSIIHASSSAHRVKLDRLTRRNGRPTWFDQRLIAVRRLLPAEGEFRFAGSESAMPATRVVAKQE